LICWVIELPDERQTGNFIKLSLLMTVDSRLALLPFGRGSLLTAMKRKRPFSNEMKKGLQTLNQPKSLIILNELYISF